MYCMRLRMWTWDDPSVKFLHERRQMMRFPSRIPGPLIVNDFILTTADWVIPAALRRAYYSKNPKPEERRLQMWTNCLPLVSLPLLLLLLLFLCWAKEPLQAARKGARLKTCIIDSPISGISPPPILQTHLLFLPAWEQFNVCDESNK